jgi:hypothetical protein
MNNLLKTGLVATLLAGSVIASAAFAQSSTTPGTITPTADCTDVAADPNCKPNQNQKEQSDGTGNPDGGLNNPSQQADEPTTNNNEQGPGATGSPENASAGGTVSPPGSGNVEGDNAGGAGSAGSSGTNN